MNGATRRAEGGRVELVLSESRRLHVRRLGRIGCFGRRRLDSGLEEGAHDLRLRARRMLLARADTIEKGGAKLEQAWQLLRVLPRRLRDRFPKQSEVRRENALQALEGQP